MFKPYFWISVAIAAGLIYAMNRAWGPEMRRDGAALREEARRFHVDPPDPRLADARYYSVPLEVRMTLHGDHGVWGGILASEHQLPVLSGRVLANGLDVHDAGLPPLLRRNWFSSPCLIWNVLVEFEYTSSTHLDIFLNEDLGLLNPGGFADDSVGHLAVPLNPVALVDYHRTDNVHGSTEVRGGTLSVRQTGPVVAP